MKTDIVESDKTKAILQEFENKMADNMVDLEPEFQKVIDDNFWELIEE